MAVNMYLVVDKEVFTNLMDIGKLTPERGKYPYRGKVRACARQSTYNW